MFECQGTPMIARPNPGSWPRFPTGSSNLRSAVDRSASTLPPSIQPDAVDPCVDARSRNSSSGSMTGFQEEPPKVAIQRVTVQAGFTDHRPIYRGMLIPSDSHEHSSLLLFPFRHISNPFFPLFLQPRSANFFARRSTKTVLRCLNAPADRSSIQRPGACTIFRKYSRTRQGYRM